VKKVENTGTPAVINVNVDSSVIDDYDNVRVVKACHYPM